ncbi:MAG: type III pantothenate kinase [Gemmatimonadota bacterium]|nr:type III pantothenate kinase [Gemmatimonadota bacterium]
MGRKLLVFDVGNSRLKAALYDGDRLIARVSLSGVQDATQVVNVLKSRFAPSGTPDHCLVASVVRGADEVIQKAVQTVWAIAPQVVDTEMDLGIDVAVPRPDHVGIDRLLQASEAFRVCAGSVVVAAFGSALTVDLVTADGVFRGGTIAPGLGMGLRALHDETSLLPHVALQPPDSAAGTDTTSCIWAGVIYGAAGAVERLFSELAPDGHATLVLTGGDAEVIAPFIKYSHRVEPDLVMRALVSLDRRIFGG